jgi:hypothetical protein
MLLAGRIEWFGELSVYIALARSNLDETAQPIVALSLALHGPSTSILATAPSDYCFGNRFQSGIEIICQSTGIDP